MKLISLALTRRPARELQASLDADVSKMIELGNAAERAQSAEQHEFWSTFSHFGTLRCPRTS